MGSVRQVSGARERWASTSGNSGQAIVLVSRLLPFFVKTFVSPWAYLCAAYVHDCWLAWAVTGAPVTAICQGFAREKVSEYRVCWGRDGGFPQEGWAAALWRPGPGFLILELRADWFP